MLVVRRPIHRFEGVRRFALSTLVTKTLLLLLSVVAIFMLATVSGTAGPTPDRKPPCSLDLGKVSTEGLIVAADVPRGSAPRLVFGKPTRMPQPPYPIPARVDCAVGRIVILAKVSEIGAVTSAEVRFGGHPALDAAAMRAAMGWRFSPTTADDVAVPAYAQIIFHFSAY